MALTIKIDQSDIDRIKNDLRNISNGMPLAVVRSINRVVDGVRTDMVEIARTVYTVKATAARKNITVRKANTGDMTAWTESKGKPIPLIDFKVSPSSVQPKRKSLIQAEVIKGEKKPVHGQFGHGGFVAVMPKNSKTQPAGHKGVFERKASTRLHITELYGPRIEDLYARPENQEKLQTGADKRLMNELERQTDYIFKQRNGLL